MKFRATLSHRGQRALEKGCLPTFEKFGKRVQILLDPEGIYLCQTPDDTDGIQLSSRVASVRRAGRRGEGECALELTKGGFSVMPHCA